MSRFAPSVEEEREALLLNRLRRAAGAGMISAEENRVVHSRNAEGWRSFSPTVRSVLFVLIGICVATFAWLADELHLPYGVLTLVCALAAAEYLIQRRRLFRAGIDEALWLGGCLALIISLPGPARPEGLLLFALAALVAGMRLRQSLFITASVVLICSYMVSRSADRWIVEVLALAIAFVALALLTWQWRNPCVEATLVALVVVMPVFSYILDRIEGSEFRSAIIIVVAAITAAGMIVTGLSIRHHAPLAAGLIAIAIVLLEWGERSSWLLEWRLLAAGGILSWSV